MKSNMVKSRADGWALSCGQPNLSVTFQSLLHNVILALAHCALRTNVPTLSYGRALYCIRAPGMTRTYVAKEPYGRLGLIVGPLKPFTIELLQIIAKFLEACQNAHF